MPRDPDAALYVISVAAELAGVHPQTLRLYERKGLLDPARTDGGNRRYSEADLDRLSRIGDLTAAGVNLEGVRRILELEDELAALRTELAGARGTDPSRWRPGPYFALGGTTWAGPTTPPAIGIGSADRPPAGPRA